MFIEIEIDTISTILLLHFIRIVVLIIICALDFGFFLHFYFSCQALSTVCHVIMHRWQWYFWQKGNFIHLQQFFSLFVAIIMYFKKKEPLKTIFVPFLSRRKKSEGKGTVSISSSPLIWRTADKHHSRPKKHLFFRMSRNKKILLRQLIYACTIYSRLLVIHLGHLRCTEVSLEQLKEGEKLNQKSGDKFKYLNWLNALLNCFFNLIEGGKKWFFFHIVSK